MAVAYVRDTGKVSAAGVDSAAASFSTLPAAGNTVSTLVSVFDTVGVNDGGVTDNQSNTYTRDLHVELSDASVSIHTDQDIGTPSGTFTVTCNPNDASSWIEFIAVEFSGVADSAALDQTATATGTNTTPTVTTGATAQADEVALGILAVSHGTGDDLGIDQPAGWTLLGSIVQNGFATIGHMACYKILAATGTQTFDGGTLAVTPTAWAIGCATYKGVAAGTTWPGWVMASAGGWW